MTFDRSPLDGELAPSRMGVPRAASGADLETAGRLTPLFVKTVRAGEVVYHAGRDSSRLYRLSHGHVYISQLLLDGRRSIVDLVEPGGYFGFCATGAHDCTATATADGKLSVYSAAQVLAHPREAKVAMASAAAQLDRVTNLMTLRSRRAVERLATFLLNLSPGDAEDPHTLLLPLSREEIADFLQLTKETVSRGFAELKAAEAVVADGRRLAHVLDRARLAAIARGKGDAPVIAAEPPSQAAA